MSEKPSPSAIYNFSDTVTEYRIGMLEHGYIVPTPPWDRGKSKGKRAEPCGLLHQSDWTDWRTYHVGDRSYEGRWCRVCGHTNVRSALARSRPDSGKETADG